MSEPPKKRGGAGRGQGRKPLGTKPSVVIQARVTEEQRDTYLSVGGSKWLRQKLDEAKKKD